MIVSARNLCSKNSVLKWLILIGLLWTQFAHASHQLTHGTDELGEPCQICTGFDHFENALSEPLRAGMNPVAASVLPTCFAILELADHLRGYSARASPLSPDISF